MRTISVREALRDNQYAIVMDGYPKYVYELYPSKDIACRICNDLNRRYGSGAYYVAAIDLGE